MIKGSHNTMSYLPPWKWYLRPFAVWAKCQQKILKDQMAAGVRYYDLRVRFDKEGVPYFCHGAMRYRCSDDVRDIVRELAEWSAEISDRIYIRVLLETTSTMSQKERARQEKLFTKLKKGLRAEDRECPSQIVLSFGVKFPWEWDRTNLPPFCEISKQFDKKWHAALPPKYWTWEQDRIERALKDSGFDGILVKDFI